MVNDLHLVFGPPASGKTTYAKGLTARVAGVLLDSDVVCDRLVRAGLELAGMDPDDRDSPAYKKAFREAVYETLYDIASINLAHVPVIIVGPFTREAGEVDWPERIMKRLGVMPEFHFVWCPAEKRRERVMARSEKRDRAKLADWDNYSATCREERPVFPHRFVMTG